MQPDPPQSLPHKSRVDMQFVAYVCEDTFLAPTAEMPQDYRRMSDDLYVRQTLSALAAVHNRMCSPFIYVIEEVAEVCAQSVSSINFITASIA
eukprot:3949475-Heterocapsa_arctica.AAC.1